MGDSPTTRVKDLVGSLRQSTVRLACSDPGQHLTALRPSPSASGARAGAGPTLQACVAGEESPRGAVTGVERGGYFTVYITTLMPQPACTSRDIRLECKVRLRLRTVRSRRFSEIFHQSHLPSRPLPCPSSSALPFGCANSGAAMYTAPPPSPSLCPDGPDHSAGRSPFSRPRSSPARAPGRPPPLPVPPRAGRRGRR